MSPRNSIRLCVFLSIVIFFSAAASAITVKEGWKKDEVNLRLPGNTRIKGIYHPADKPVPTLAKKDYGRVAKTSDTTADISFSQFLTTTTSSVGVNVINSPPIDGFVPWIAVLTTDDREEPLVLDAVKRTSMVGDLTTTSPQFDYSIGIFDTGASAHVMGFEAASTLGLYDIDPITEISLVTDKEIEISGVTGHVTASVSYPIGVYIDGLSSINTMGQLDYSNMMGQSNVSIVVGQNNGPSIPDLPTAIGSPLAVYYTASFKNDTPIVVEKGGVEYVGPDIKFYDEDSEPNYPIYPNTLPLELRPLGGISVQYVPDFGLEDLFAGGDVTFEKPASPSTIIGNLSQSIMFVHAVDLKDGTSTALDKDRFMLDTGAQVTVIGTRVAARLELDPDNSDFLVEIQGVTGIIDYYPGFYIDSIEIPAMGQWLRYSNVPVVLLDVSSPEGGKLDGIIGMNLFVDHNFVLKGGGIFLQEDPVLMFEQITRLAGDITPGFGDGIVNDLDVQKLASVWLASSSDADWSESARYDIAPDGTINYLDFLVIASNWLQTQ
jgi:aspartyl protease